MSYWGREAAKAASSEAVEITSPLPTLPRLRRRVGRGRQTGCFVGTLPGHAGRNRSIAHGALERGEAIAE